MKIIEVKDQIEGGKVAFDILKETLKEGAQTLGLATGSSPLEFYKQIRESDLDLSNLISVNLDEYVGLTGDDPQSYRYFMEKNLFDAKPFKESYLPSGVEESADQEVIRYNKILEEHPVDLQILGIGRNGHIGFNEPCDVFDPITHQVTLDERTIRDNARFFNSSHFDGDCQYLSCEINCLVCLWGIKSPSNQRYSRG